MKDEGKRMKDKEKKNKKKRRQKEVKLMKRINLKKIK